MTGEITYEIPEALSRQMMASTGHTNTSAYASWMEQNIDMSTTKAKEQPRTSGQPPAPRPQVAAVPTQFTTPAGLSLDGNSAEAEGAREHLDVGRRRSFMGMALARKKSSV